MNIQMTKITSKGQVVIPQEIREEAGINEGERFFVYANDKSIVLRPVKDLEASDDFDEFENTFKSMWRTAKGKGITKIEIDKEIKAVRTR